MIIRFALVILFVVVAPSAFARVFSYSDNSVAAYFRGTGGMHMMGAQGYSVSSGSSTYFDTKDEPEYNYSGEIGLMFLMGEDIGLRIGVEGLQSREVKAPGKSAQGVSLLNVESTVVAFVPNMTLEVKLASGPASKAYAFLGVGYVTIKGTNNYTMTAAGTTLYGNSDYKETVAGTAIMSQAGLGFEFLFVDNCALSTEVGWRYLPVSKLKHQDSVTAVSGAVAKGATAKDWDGNDRTYDMGGPFVGVAFRFYIPPMR